MKRFEFAMVGSQNLGFGVLHEVVPFRVVAKDKRTARECAVLHLKQQKRIK